MFEELYEAAKSTSGNRSKYFEQLSHDQQVFVTGFVAWLPSQGLSRNSVNSYKSYITKAMVKTLAGEKLTNDEKSAVRKFQDFMKALDQLSEELAE